MLTFSSRFCLNPSATFPILLYIYIHGLGEGIRRAYTHTLSSSRLKVRVMSSTRSYWDDVGGPFATTGELLVSRIRGVGGARLVSDGGWHHIRAAFSLRDDNTTRFPLVSWLSSYIFAVRKAVVRVHRPRIYSTGRRTVRHTLADTVSDAYTSSPRGVFPIVLRSSPSVRTHVADDARCAYDGLRTHAKRIPRFTWEHHFINDTRVSAAMAKVTNETRGFSFFFKFFLIFGVKELKSIVVLSVNMFFV